MRTLLLLVSAPLVLALAQPARTVVAPAPSVVSLDSHVARHPKSKVAAARTKSAVQAADKATTTRGAVGVKSTATPLPAVHPRAKTPRSAPPQ
ncbi:MAG: hypothetical protein ABMA00_04425 [Gemmatimonas sp.]